MENGRVLQFGGNDLCVLLLACRAVSSSAELPVFIYIPAQKVEGTTDWREQKTGSDGEGKVRADCLHHLWLLLSK